jgi:hypothetical protein
MRSEMTVAWSRVMAIGTERRKWIQTVSEELLQYCNRLAFQWCNSFYRSLHFLSVQHTSQITTLCPFETHNHPKIFLYL